MNRDEFEVEYAKKYTNGDVLAVFGNRDFKRYADPHIDLCWRVQQAKNKENTIICGLAVQEIAW